MMPRAPESGMLPALNMQAGVRELLREYPSLGRAVAVALLVGGVTVVATNATRTPSAPTLHLPPLPRGVAALNATLADEEGVSASHAIDPDEAGESELPTRLTWSGS